MSKTYEHYRVRLTITKEPRISSRKLQSTMRLKSTKKSSHTLSRARA